MKQSDIDHLVDVSTHMPLARHDLAYLQKLLSAFVSTHMPLARHDSPRFQKHLFFRCFYSHASCEA